MHRRTQPHVYFVRRADGEGPVKIGCSQSPDMRLQQLTYWCPYPLALVAMIPGDESLERRFHAKFWERHTHSEWFLASAELEQTLAELASGTFKIEGLPEGRRLPAKDGKRKEPWSADRRLAQSLQARIRRHPLALPSEVNDASYRLRHPDAGVRGDALRVVAAFLRSAGPLPKRFDDLYATVIEPAA